MRSRAGAGKNRAWGQAWPTVCWPGKRGVRMIQYIVTQSMSRERTIYGIAVINDCVELDRLPDIAMTLEDATRLAALLQTHGVAAEHFRDVVEDHLLE